MVLQSAQVCLLVAPSSSIVSKCIVTLDFVVTRSYENYFYELGAADRLILWRGGILAGQYLLKRCG